jgi:SAM-dependent methyltransferase
MGPRISLAQTAARDGEYCLGGAPDGLRLKPMRSTDLDEDLVALAEYAFRIAQDSCTNCQGYHALWGYERLARIKGNSFRTDSDILEPLLRAHLPFAGGFLIVGAADAGLLSFVAQVTRELKPQITVVDRCATPLAVCRRYAEAKDLSIETVVADLTEDTLPSKHDLAFAHNILMLQPLTAHAAFLRNIGRALTQQGTLVLVHRVRPAKSETLRLPSQHYASRILGALSTQGIALPENETDFCRRLEAYAEVQHSWSDAVVDLPHVEAALAEAGFRIQRRIDHDRRRTVPDRDGGQAIPMPTHVFVAKRE